MTALVLVLSLSKIDVMTAIAIFAPGTYPHITHVPCGHQMPAIPLTRFFSLMMSSLAPYKTRHVNDPPPYEVNCKGTYYFEPLPTADLAGWQEHVANLHSDAGSGGLCARMVRSTMPGDTASLTEQKGK